MASIQNLNFVPTSVAGCSVWLDAADVASVVTSGTSVTQWNDKSGNSRTFTSVANPNYITNVRNGQGVVRFSNSYLQSPSVALFSSASSGGSFFFVFQTTNNAGQSFLLTYPNQTSGVFCQTETEIGIDTGAGTGVGNFGLHRGCGYATIAAANTIANSTFYIMEVILATSGTTPTNVSIFQNGTSLSVSNDSLGYYSAGSYPNANNARSLVLGGRANIGASPDSFFTGDMAEVLWYSGPVSVVQRQQIEGYLAWKWGLQGNLPSTHPYKLIAPNSANLGYPSALTVAVPQVSFAQSALPLAFFNPLSITGCVLWLDALNPSNTGTLPAAGSTVSTWTDRSGNANNATGGSATFQVNILNGFPAITFAGNTVYSLAKPTILSTGQTSGSTLFVVFRVTSTSVTDAGIFGQSPANPGNCDKTGRVLYYNSGGTLFGTMYCGFASTSTSYTLGQSAFISDVYTNTGTGSYTHTSFLNGTAFGTTGATVTGANTSSYIAQIGALNVGGTNYTGNIFEILYFNNTLSTTARQQIEGYLAWKWGLTGSLPSNHPYKNNMPTAFGTVPITLFGIRPGPFLPTQISGLQMWLDGTDPNGNGTVPANGSSILTWADKSGNGKNASTATGTITFTNNGLVFSGTQAMSTTLSSVTTSQTIFVVASASSSSIIEMVGVDSASTGTGIILRFTNYVQEVVRFGGTIVASGGTVTTSTRFLFDTTYNSGGSSFLYLNGSQTGANASSATISGTGTVLIGGYRLGSNFGELYSGTLNEILIYNTVLSTGQRQSVEGYLAWKWDLVGNLPANHPFKKFPPPPQ